MISTDYFSPVIESQKVSSYHETVITSDATLQSEPSEQVPCYLDTAILHHSKHDDDPEECSLSVTNEIIYLWLKIFIQYVTMLEINLNKIIGV